MGGRRVGDAERVERLLRSAAPGLNFFIAEVVEYDICRDLGVDPEQHLFNEDCRCRRWRADRPQLLCEYANIRRESDMFDAAADEAYADCLRERDQLDPWLVSPHLFGEESARDA